MHFFWIILGGILEIVGLGWAAILDFITLGGVLTDQDDPYLVKHFNRISKDDENEQ